MAMALRSSRAPVLPLSTLSPPATSPPSHVQLLPSWRSPDLQALLPAPLASHASLRFRRSLVVCANAAAQLSVPEGMCSPCLPLLISRSFFFVLISIHCLTVSLPSPLERSRQFHFFASLTPRFPLISGSHCALFFSMHVYSEFSFYFSFFFYFFLLFLICSAERLLCGVWKFVSAQRLCSGKLRLILMFFFMNSSANSHSSRDGSSL